MHKFEAVGLLNDLPLPSNGRVHVLWIDDEGYKGLDLDIIEDNISSGEGLTINEVGVIDKIGYPYFQE